MDSFCMILAVIFLLFSTYVVCLLILFGWLIVTTMVQIPSTPNTPFKTFLLKVIHIIWPYIVLQCVLNIAPLPFLRCYQFYCAQVRKLAPSRLFRAH